MLLLPRLTTDQDETPRTQYGCATESPWITTYHHGPVTDYAGLSRSITDPLQFKPDEHGCITDTLQMLPFRPDCTTIEADIQPGSTYSVDSGPSVHMLLCHSQGHISCHHVAEVQEVEADSSYNFALTR